MGEIVVKHYKRTGVNSDDKELVTEIVVDSSDTSRFLQRVEESRLTRPCFQSIDLRGRVAGECYRYAFNDRVHYLDEISFQLFEQGLRTYKGVYTVGTFEAIMSAAQASRGQQSDPGQSARRPVRTRQRHTERGGAAAPGPVDGNSQAVKVQTDESAARVANPTLLPMGYFRKRSHPRLQYDCAVLVQQGDIRVNGTTCDISVCGARVSIKGLTAFKQDQEVLLSYPGLANDAGPIDVNHIAYRIISCDQGDEDTELCLHRSDSDTNTGFSTFLAGFIERYRRKYKLDVDDEYQSLLSWYYERIYAQSATQIPFFIEQGDGTDLRVQALAMSEGNLQLARFFCNDADNYNFTPVCLPHRLQRLQHGGAFFLVMYRQRGKQDQSMRIHSAADFELHSDKVFQAMINYAVRQAEHCVVKVQASQLPAVYLSGQKLKEVSQRLRIKSETQMDSLHDRLQRLRSVGCIIDVTADFKRLMMNATESSPTAAELAAWVGSEQRCLVTGAVKKKLTIPPEDMRPELIRFGYVERRREDRYLAETRVHVSIGGTVYQGLSKDISTRGMRIQLQKHREVKKGIAVTVGLVSLQAKKPGTNLMNIPYRVVRAASQQEGTVLMLERISGGKCAGLDEFFVELINRNRHKLAVDIGDIWAATTSRVYEALLAGNTPNVPFFLARNNEGGAHLQFVGIVEAGGPLLNYFSTPGGFDFRCLNERRVVTTIYNAIQILLRRSRNSDDKPTPFELDMYLHKTFDESTGETLIHAASDLDFDTDAQRELFLANLTGYPDWRCIRIVATFTQSLEAEALEKMVATLRPQSKHRAIKLSDLAHSLVGCGELIDISKEWAWLRARGDNTANLYRP